MVKKVILLMCLIVLSALIFSRLNAWESVKVLKVIDAETFLIEYEGGEETLSLIGIDSPKASPENSAGKSSKYIDGLREREKAALEFTKSLVKKGDIVLVDFDVRKYDKAHRFVGYVYFKNGQMLNEAIIEEGYSRVVLEPPNTKFEKRFMEAYRIARESRRGMWK